MPMSANIKYRQLKAFAMVAENGSFRAAAEQLAVTQPSLSALIKELEIDVGISLLERTTRRCALTEAGRVFYNDIKSALQHLDMAYHYVKEAGSGSRGRLSVAALPSLAAGIVTRAVGQFRDKNPNVRIQLAEGKNDEILAAIRQGQAEIGVGSMWQPDSELSFEELLTDRMMLVAPKRHPISTMRATLKLAEQFDLILMNAGPTAYALQQSHVNTPPAYQVGHLSTVLAMVRHGFGISILPSSVRTVMKMDGLICKEIEGPMAIRRLGIIVKRESKLSPTASAFMAILKRLSSKNDRSDDYH